MVPPLPLPPRVSPPVSLGAGEGGGSLPEGGKPGQAVAEGLGWPQGEGSPGRWPALGCSGIGRPGEAEGLGRVV